MLSRGSSLWAISTYQGSYLLEHKLDQKEEGVSCCICTDRCSIPVATREICQIDRELLIWKSIIGCHHCKLHYLPGNEWLHPSVGIRLILDPYFGDQNVIVICCTVRPSCEGVLAFAWRNALKQITAVEPSSLCLPLSLCHALILLSVFVTLPSPSPSCINVNADWHSMIPFFCQQMSSQVLWAHKPT